MEKPDGSDSRTESGPRVWEGDYSNWAIINCKAYSADEGIYNSSVNTLDLHVAQSRAKLHATEC